MIKVEGRKRKENFNSTSEIWKDQVSLPGRERVDRTLLQLPFTVHVSSVCIGEFSRRGSSAVNKTH